MLSIHILGATPTNVLVSSCRNYRRWDGRPRRAVMDAHKHQYVHSDSFQYTLTISIEDICDPRQKDLFVCADSQVIVSPSVKGSQVNTFMKVFYTASIVWGVIGPANQFSRGQTY